MGRFDLNSLPQCGAKTRSGEPCKRLGNLHNGRCKLHGGRSTGGKTTEGKMAMRTNPIKYSFDRFGRQELDDDLIHEGLDVFERLVELGKLAAPDDWMPELEALLAEHLVALEYAKHIIAATYGPDGFMLAQCALDHYYKQTDALHLHFHIFRMMPGQLWFQQLASRAQISAQNQWDARHIRPGGFPKVRKFDARNMPAEFNMLRHALKMLKESSL
ncbi:MAG: hypothetical protein LPD71_00435 [Shewanella sp.]|nr:hypothetical protein [Shewanella sp.]